MARIGDNFVTNFEKLLIAGTADQFDTVEKYHTPISVLNGESPQITTDERRKTEFALVAPQIFSFDLKNLSGIIAITLEDLDPATNATIKDPKVWGVWDKETDKVVAVPDRNLTMELYKRLKEMAKMYPNTEAELAWKNARDGKTLILESESAGDPEKG